jgi:hypothetical protein
VKSIVHSGHILNLCIHQSLSEILAFFETSSGLL